MSTAADEVAFNPFDPGFTQNPYPQRKALRDQAPVYETPLGFWVLTKYDDVLRFVRDPKTSVEDRHANPSLMTHMQEQSMADLGIDPDERRNRAMLGLDSPDHTRLRRLVQKAFTPRAIARLEPRIHELVENALDKAAA